jgi:ubiquinone/menaquinone biosynthesis C-methylase UbiE
MRTVLAIALSALCAGCGNWSGFGFRADGAEMLRLKEQLSFAKGSVLADVGAGKGELTFALARQAGHVYATEIDPERLRRLREAVAAGKLDNVTVIEARGSQSGLPPDCCDAIVLRRVYHHLAEPAKINASLLRALRPGGLLAVIDFAPPLFLGRGGFGVPAQSVVDEVTGSGFELQRRIEDWPGRGPLGSYCLVFRAPS